MTQNVVRENLALYLEIINPDATKEICDRLRQDGLCHGLVTSYCNHKTPKAKECWRAKLAAVANWRGDINGLRKMIVFSGENTPVSLQTIFKEVLNAVVYKQGENHSPGLQDYFPDDDFEQKEFLQHHDDVIEDGKIKKLIQLESVSGDFNIDEINELLEEDLFTHDYISASNRKHIIAIGADEDEYWVYDPNYDHTSEEAMVKTFAYREDFISEIQSRLENLPISLIAGSWQKKRRPCFPSIYKLMENNVELITENGGLALMAQDSPEQALLALQLLEKKPDGLQLIVKRLKFDENIDYTTGYAIIEIGNPSLLLTLFKLSETFSVIAKAMGECLTKKTADGSLPLNAFIKKNPQLLPQLFLLGDRTPAIQQAILTAMKDNDAGWTPLHYFIYCASEFLPELLERANQSPELRQIITDGFSQPNEYGNTCLYLLLSEPQFRTKKLTEDFLRCIANTPNGHLGG